MDFAQVSYGKLTCHIMCSELTRSPPEAGPPSPTVSEFSPRSKAIDFDDRTLHHRPSNLSQVECGSLSSPDVALTEHYPLAAMSARDLPAFSPLTRRPARMGSVRPDSAMTTGYGGFPNPVSIAVSAVSRRIAAGTERRPSVQSAEVPAPKISPDQSFAPTEGRNSKFKGLTVEQQEELGGVEFRVSRLLGAPSRRFLIWLLLQALTLLLRIVIGYSLVLPLLSILILAPWLSTSTPLRAIFAAADTTVNPTWFTVFTVYSAFGNCGLR